MRALIPAIFKKIQTLLSNVSTVDGVVDNCYTELGSGSGIPGTFKSVQRGTISLAGVASNTATISAVTTSKSRLRYLGSTTDTDSASVNLNIVLTNSTTITASRGFATGGAITSVVSYEIEEVY